MNPIALLALAGLAPAGPVPGAPGASEQERSAEVPSVAPAPVAWLEPTGGSPDSFALTLRGAPPAGRAVLWIRSEGRPPRARAVPLDGAGGARVEVPAGRLETPCQAWFQVRGPGAGAPAASSNQVALPPAGGRDPSPFQRGGLVINEFMKDPAAVPDSSGEWVELWNTTGHGIDIEGWILADDGGNRHTVSNGGRGVRVPPGGFLLLGNDADPSRNGGLLLDYRYSSFTLANGSDEIIVISRKGILVDRVAYDDGVLWPDLSGHSISLDPASANAGENDFPRAWCHASSPIGPQNPDTGTPGRPNDLCP